MRLLPFWFGRTVLLDDERDLLVRSIRALEKNSFLLRSRTDPDSEDLKKGAQELVTKLRRRLAS